MDNPEDRFEICGKRRAILDGSGHMLVVGGPGSGKTTIALLKARRTVLERLRPEQSVLFLSFSNAAIRRILESGASILTNEIGRQVEIKTYHSFAWDILRSHGYLLSSQRNLTVIGAHDAAVLRAGLEDADWSVEEERLFVEDGRVTYDQFAPRAADLLERSGVVRKCFSHVHPLILVDEFQDTDEEQWRLIRTLSDDSEIIALGDAEQRIYAWRKGVSATRLQDFAARMDATTFDFQDENNRSPATGIAGYARSLLAPNAHVDLPEDIVLKRCPSWQFEVGLRFAVFGTWKETVSRTGRRDWSLAVAARSRSMVRLISDLLGNELTVRGKTYRPVRHDVMFDQDQIALAARVVAFVMASPAVPHHERLAGALERVGAVPSVFGWENRDQGIESTVGVGGQVPRRQGAEHEMRRSLDNRVRGGWFRRIRDRGLACGSSSACPQRRRRTQTHGGPCAVSAASASGIGDRTAAGGTLEAKGQLRGCRGGVERSDSPGPAHRQSSGSIANQRHDDASAQGA